MRSTLAIGIVMALRYLAAEQVWFASTQPDGYRTNGSHNGCRRLQCRFDDGVREHAVPPSRLSARE